MENNSVWKLGKSVVKSQNVKLKLGQMKKIISSYSSMNAFLKNGDK